MRFKSFSVASSLSLARPVSMIVLHYTGMPDADGALDRLTSPDAGVSAHYCVKEDGEVVPPLAHPGA